MALDEQVVQMIRDRFDRQDETLKRIETSRVEHADKDAGYWKQIDDQHAQLRLAKWVGGSGAFAAATAWLYEFFKSR